MSVAMTLAGARALSVRLVIPERGAWLADVDLDPESGAALPTGRVVLAIGDAQLSGTVDPRATGRFVAGARVRVVGGAGGWDTITKQQHFHNDAGVKSSQVYAATAAQIGETVNDPAPISLGADFVRDAGAASRVFEDRPWYVDLAGTTQVGARPAATPDSSLEVLGYDAAAQRLEVTCDAIVLPGTQFTDARIDGTLVAREVEQAFTPHGGARATVICGAKAGAGFAALLRNAVEELGGLALLRVYRYRFVTATANRLNLQAVEKGAPDLQPVDVWPGMAGLSAKLTPSQTVLVAFINGERTMPIIVGFDGALPKELTLDATDKVHLGPTAPAVEIAGGGNPIARLGDAVRSFLPASMQIVGTISGSPFTGTITVANPISGIIIGGSGKGSVG